MLGFPKSCPKAASRSMCTLFSFYGHNPAGPESFRKSSLWQTHRAVILSSAVSHLILGYSAPKRKIIIFKTRQDQSFIFMKASHDGVSLPFSMTNGWQKTSFLRSLGHFPIVIFQTDDVFMIFAVLQANLFVSNTCLAAHMHIHLFSSARLLVT